MNPNALTERERDVYRFIVDTIGQWLCPPTCREICDQFGFRSPNSATKYLHSLEEKGWLKRCEEGPVSRNMVPTNRDDVIMAIASFQEEPA